MFHNREYLVAVRPLEGVLALHTMRFADELVDPGDLDIPKPSRKPRQARDQDGGHAGGLAARALRPDAFQDTYRERVLE